MTLVMGGVAYDPKVVTIWEGFRNWFRTQGFDFDYVLYSNYERQVDDLVAGHIHAAWNSPLAWVRTERLAAAHGRTVRSAVMRDTDQDLTSVIVVLADSPAGSLADLDGVTIGAGAVDSPQATLIPLSHLRDAGVTGANIRRFDVGVGLHGDHVGGERDAAKALAAGEVGAAIMIDGNYQLFCQEGTLSADGTRVLDRTGMFDHCTMAIIDSAPPDEAERFVQLLQSMSYDDPDVRPLLDLEGLTRWVPGRTSGYGPLQRAVDETGFYTRDGAVTAEEYSP
ncbi:MAG: PhnD/SsuA/transferrin family substrate-binding protein [Actinomycetospora sp.]|nr:PhnD/SsuA/transferrin family substrate-binding protein [Actinomycetospora sp.]